MICYTWLYYFITDSYVVIFVKTNPEIPVFHFLVFSPMHLNGDVGDLMSLVRGI